MKKTILTLLLSLTLLFGYSQSSNIDPQRPTLTESNTLVDKGVLQFENGVTMNSVETSLDNPEVNYNVFVRYSIADVLELRSNLDLESPNFNLGAKFALLRSNNKLGLGVSGIYTYTSPIDVNSESTSDYRLAVTKTFNKGLFLTYNIGNDTSFNEIYHIGLLGKSFGRFGVFGEYNYVTNIKQLNRVHAGATYRILSNLQVDINGGYYTSTDEYYGGLGVSFNVR